MANEGNTVASHTTCPAHLEVWRKQAAQAAADDRYTVLFHQVVEAFGDIGGEPADAAYYGGLRDAYVTITGDSKEMVDRQVRDALDRQLCEELAEPEPVPVPS